MSIADNVYKALQSKELSTVKGQHMEAFTNETLSNICDVKNLHRFGKA